MKKNVLSSLIAILVIALLSLYSCKKDKSTVFMNNQTNKSTSSYPSLSAWVKTMRPAIQKFTVNGTTGGTVVGDRGYKFIFAPGSLVDNIGNAISGNVDVRLTEVTNAAEMLATGAKTEAVDGILGSAGMFNLQLTKQGTGVEVFINQNKPVRAQVVADPSVVMTNVEVLKGNVILDTANNGDTTIKWNRTDSTNTKTPKYNYDSIQKIYDSIQKAYLQKRCIQFDLYFGKWCNLDRYYNDASGTQISIKAEGTADNKDTRVFMYLNQNYLKGFYELTRDFSKTEEYNSTNYNLPIGWVIKIIVVTRTQNNEVKYEMRDITNASSTTVHTFNSLKTISDKDLEALFKSL